MQIPTQEALIAVVAAFRRFDSHCRFCGTCEPDMRLPELCTVGQCLTLDAVGSMTSDEAVVIEPFPPTAAGEFERNVREQVHAELVYYADRLEVAQPERADVCRDAHEVRRAARVVRDGLGRHFFAGCLAEDPTRHMDELSRQRALLDEEIVLHAVAQDRIRDLEHELATGDPERMAILRPEFIAGASAEAIQLKIARARMNNTRWTNRVARLEALLEERLTQIEAGAWPAPDGGHEHATCKCPKGIAADHAVLPQRTSRPHPDNRVDGAVQPDAPTS